MNVPNRTDVSSGKATPSARVVGVAVSDRRRPAEDSAASLRPLPVSSRARALVVIVADLEVNEVVDSMQRMEV